MIRGDEWSLANVNVNSQVALVFNARLQVRHLVVVVNPVHHEVWEPRVLSLCLEQLVEQSKTFLAKFISEDFERHQGLVVEQRLGEEGQSVVIN